ncbi:MAG: hypothetical protein LBV74_14345 [Tannerella sp.]|nr:hypothetical protein [Tannerella sp.]
MVRNSIKIRNDLNVSNSSFICLKNDFRIEINYGFDTGILSSIQIETFMEICFGIHSGIINDAGIGFNTQFCTGVHV